MVHLFGAPFCEGRAYPIPASLCRPWGPAVCELREGLHQQLVLYGLEIKQMSPIMVQDLITYEVKL